MQSDPNLNLHKPLTGESALPRWHVHGSAFMPGDRLKWLFDFTLTLECPDDAAAQTRVFEIFTEYDIDLAEIEEADPCD